MPLAAAPVVVSERGAEQGSAGPIIVVIIMVEEDFCWRAGPGSPAKVKEAAGTRGHGVASGFHIEHVRVGHARATMSEERLLLYLVFNNMS